MESREARLKRLGVLIKRRRKARGMTRVDDLADAADVGRTTLVAIETGRKSVTAAMYNSLELELGLPIGTMERVLSGEIAEFPAAVDETSTDEDLSTEELRDIVKVMTEQLARAKDLLAKLDAQRDRATPSRSNRAVQ